METIQFLGIYFHSNLTWIAHINHVATKIEKPIGILFKATHCLPSQTLRTLYDSLIYPYLYYGNVIWVEYVSLDRGV